MLMKIAANLNAIPVHVARNVYNRGANLQNSRTLFVLCRADIKSALENGVISSVFSARLEGPMAANAAFQNGMLHQRVDNHRKLAAESGPTIGNRGKNQIP